MTAYANLRNVLATMHAAHYFDDNATISNDLIDAFTNAQNDLEDHLFDTCHTSADFDHVYERFDKMVERAARTASKGDADFIAAVMNDVHQW